MNLRGVVVTIVLESLIFFVHIYVFYFCKFIKNNVVNCYSFLRGIYFIVFLKISDHSVVIRQSFEGGRALASQMAPLLSDK